MNTALKLRNKSFSYDTELSQQLSTRERAVGAYLGLATGDALGATTEFMTPAEIRNKFGTHRQICGGGWLNIKQGQVTDDTEMSLALGEAILANKGVEEKSAALAFSEWMRTKPVDIGNTVRRGIIHFRNTGKTEVEVNAYDAGNGACMRSLPVALYYWNKPLMQMLNASRIQSHITHNNAVADAGTNAVLSMLACALGGGSKEQMRYIAHKLVDREKSFRFDKKAVTNPSGWIVETLQVVFQCFFAHDNLEDIVVDTVNRGGDADTTGAIAGMLSGAYYGTRAIPESWLNALDDDVRMSCERQALALI